MNNFSEDDFLSKLLDNISDETKKSTILNTNPNNKDEKIYDFSKLSDKEFYDVYYNTQNQETEDNFKNNVDPDILDAQTSSIPGLKINIGVKNKCGGTDMPSYEKVKSQKLDNNDYDAMCAIFDEAMLDEGNFHYNGCEADYDQSENIKDNPHNNGYDSDSEKSDCSGSDHNEEQQKTGKRGTKWHDDSAIPIVTNLVSKIASEDEEYHNHHYQPFSKLNSCGLSQASSSSDENQYLAKDYISNTSDDNIDSDNDEPCTLKKKDTRGLRKSNKDEDHKEFVYDVTLMDMDVFSCSPNKIKCIHQNGDCVGRARIGDVIKLRKEFWGQDRYLDSAPTETNRKKSMKEILIKSFDQNKKSFSFFCGDIRVCERGFLILIGINTRESRPPKYWTKTVKEMQSDGFELSSFLLENNNKSGPDIARDKTFKRMKDKRSLKHAHATNYIRYVASIFADTSPTHSHIRAVPYESVSQLYEEYRIHCKSTLLNFDKSAGREVFRIAFKELQDEVKLVGAKGTFQTCDICNNANTLLRSGKIRFNKAQREIILKLKRLHLFQQMKEREHQMETRQKAIDDRNGRQPLSAYILIDGMTVYSGNTPKVGGGYFRRGKKDSIYITNRVIGVEVASGPIQKVFLYHTDNFVGGGANTMVEILRAAISDLAKELHNLGLSLPRKLALQLDNCGENKNKIMFSFLSLLIESHVFDTINVNFLIVGHTHTSIDQYFGVLTESIKSSYFIGSPISLHHLLSTAHQDPKLRPAEQRQITIIHDYKSMFAPYINDKIKYFQFPHNFIFKRVYGKACMQYKLFSSHNIWLPIPPARVAISYEELETKKLNCIPLEPLTIVDGFDKLSDELGLDSVSSLRSVIQNNSNGGSSNTPLGLDTVSKIVENVVMERIEKPSMVSMLHRFEHDEERNFAEPGFDRYDDCITNKQLSEIENYLKLKTKTNKEGYMIWLETLDKKTNVELPYLLNLSPEPIYPITLVESLIDLLPTTDSTDETILDDYLDDEFNEFGELVPQKTFNSSSILTSTGCKIKSKLIKSAKEILRVGRHVIAQVKRGHFTVNQKGDDVEYSFPILSSSEFNFYKKRSTLRGVLSIYLDEFRNLPDYEIVIIPELTESQCC